MRKQTKVQAQTVQPDLLSKVLSSKLLLPIIFFILVIAAFILTTPFVKAASTGITNIGHVGGYDSPPLDGPFGVATDSLGNTYVADTGNNRIQKFDSDGNFIAFWGSENLDPYGGSEFGGGDGEFASPAGIAVDSSNNIYVADTGNNRIQKFDSDGNFITKWGKNTVGPYGGSEYGTDNGEFNSPRGIATDTIGNIYVVDGGNYRIQKFNNSGVYISQWGTSGGADNQVNSPGGIAIDSNNTVFVSDTGNNRINEYDSDGYFLSTVGWGVSDGQSELQVCTTGCRAGESGSGVGQFKSPLGVTVDNNGNLYVSDSENNRIQKFDENGAFIDIWGSETVGPYGGSAYSSADGEFSYPALISSDEQGNIYVADAQNSRVQKLSSNGAYLKSIGGVKDGILYPYDVVSDSTGNFYAVSSGGGEGGTGKILKYDSSANLLSTWNYGTNTTVYFAAVSETYFYAVVYTLDGLRIIKSDLTGNIITQWDPGAMGFGIAVDSSENVYFTSNDSYSIKKFSSTGTFLDEWGTLGSGNGEFNFEDGPAGISVDSQDNLYVGDTGNFRVQKFDSSGNYISQFGSQGTGDGQFTFGIKPVTDSMGNIYISDYTQQNGNSRVQKFNSSGLYLGQYTQAQTLYTQPFFPGGIAVVNNGKLYLANVMSNRIEILCDHDVSTDNCASTSSPSGSTDSDSDNLSDSVEQAAPNSGDANDDGFQDSEQPNVTSLLNTITNSYSVLQTSCSANTTASLSSESSDHQDTAFDYTAGLFSFTATGCGPTATITQYFYGNLDAPKVTARKYNSTTNTYSTIPGAVITNVMIGSQIAVKIVYQVTDNGPLDEDATIGTITDPSGPAVLTVGVPETGLGRR